MLYGGAANDTRDGEDGNDTANESPLTVALIPSLPAGTGTGECIDSLINIENLIAGSGNDTPTDKALHHRIDGTPRADLMFGLLGYEMLEGGSGADAIFGGNDSD